MPINNPGPTPAMKSFDTDSWVIVPNTMNKILGGMIGPNAPEHATKDVENDSPYFSSIIAGIMIAPIVATVAGADPEIAAKNMQHTTVIIANEPVKWPK